jgi:MscS family membrane protein
MEIAMNEWISFAQEAQDVPWIRAAAVLLGSIIAARLVGLVITRLVLRLSMRTSTDLDERLIQQLHRPIFASVVLLGLYFAVKIFELGEDVEPTVVAAIQTLAVVVWTAAALKITSTALTGLSRLADRVTWLEARTLPLFENMTKILVWAVAIYCCLVAWDLDLSPWLASAGIMGIAVGFAAKDTLANLFGGLFVIMDAPYKIGDFINLDTGERGQVVRIGLRSTRLITRDDVEITLPNAHIANSKVVNESGGPYQKTRIYIEVGVAYGSDVDRVREVLLEAAKSVEFVTDDPEPRVRFAQMGDSALIFRVQGWVDDPARRGACIDGLNTAVYKALGKANIEIPFPQLVAHQAPRPTSG